MLNSLYTENQFLTFLFLMVWKWISQTLSTVSSFSKVTKPNPRCLFVCWSISITASSTLPEKSSPMNIFLATYIFYSLIATLYLLWYIRKLFCLWTTPFIISQGILASKGPLRGKKELCSRLERRSSKVLYSLELVRTNILLGNKEKKNLCKIF